MLDAEKDRSAMRLVQVTSSVALQNIQFQRFYPKSFEKLAPQDQRENPGEKWEKFRAGRLFVPKTSLRVSKTMFALVNMFFCCGNVNF